VLDNVALDNVALDNVALDNMVLDDVLPESVQPVERVTVEFWADLASPWCYVASRRLALAVAHEPDGSVQTRWRCFQRDRGAAGWDGDRRSAAAGGDPAASALERVKAVGREVGIVFDEARLGAGRDSSLAHRAVLLYDGEPRQRAVSAALYAANFLRGEDIGDLEVVVSVAAWAGGDQPGTVRSRLAAGEGLAELATDRAEARSLGIGDAPTYVVGRRLAVHGPVEVEVLRALIAEGRRAGR